LTWFHRPRGNQRGAAWNRGEGTGRPMNETEALREAVRAMVQAGTPSGLEPHGGFDAALWATLDEHGMTRVGTPEEYGGEGGGLHEAAAIVDEASYAAAFVPLAD